MKELIEFINETLTDDDIILVDKIELLEMWKNTILERLSSVIYSDDELIEIKSLLKHVNETLEKLQNEKDAI